MTLASPWAVAADVIDPPEWEPEGRPPLEPHQRPPAGDWSLWILQAGRNAGKTEAMCRYFAGYMRRHPKARGRIIAPTFGDAVASCIEGPSGLRAIDPEMEWLPSAPGGAKVHWPNGSEAIVLGTPTPRDVDRLRAGGNREIDLWEEMAANPMLGEAWDQAQLGLREGVRPHSVAATTPRTTIAYKRIISEAGVRVTRASTADNPYGQPEWKAKMYGLYQGTRLGRQELAGELLEDVEGALWKQHWIDDVRTQGITVPISRKVIGVDPGEGVHAYALATSALDHMLYVSRAELVRATPHSFARTVVGLASQEGAEILVERNHGGSWLKPIFAGAMRELDVIVPYREVWASEGKKVRADPVAALYEQGRVAHVGQLPELEDSMTTWDGTGDSPHLIDAAVWALSDLSKGMQAPSAESGAVPWSNGSVAGGAVQWAAR